MFIISSKLYFIHIDDFWFKSQIITLILAEWIKKWKRYKIAQSSSTTSRNQYRLSKFTNKEIANRNSIFQKDQRNRLKEIKTVSSRSGPTLSNTPQPVRHASTCLRRKKDLCYVCLPHKTAGVFWTNAVLHWIPRG